MRVWAVIDYDDVPPIVEGVFSSPENVLAFLRDELALQPEDCGSVEWADVLCKMKTVFGGPMHLIGAGGNIMVVPCTVDWWYETHKYKENDNAKKEKA